MSLGFVGSVAAIEATIIVGSGIDAWLRRASDPLPWPLVWFWWHIAPAWLTWKALVSALTAAALRAARRSCERFHRRQAEAPPPFLALAHDDDAPPASLEAPPNRPALPAGRLLALALLPGMTWLLRAVRTKRDSVHH